MYLELLLFSSSRCIILFFYEVFHRYTNYVFQGETIKFQNFDAMQHRKFEPLKPNQNWMLGTRTRHLKLTSIQQLWQFYRFSLDSLRPTAFDSHLNYRPELNCYFSECPFKQNENDNIHNNAVASILSI